MAQNQVKPAGFPASAPAPNRRQVHRQPFGGKVIIGWANSDSLVGRMQNISPFGCNVLAKAEWLKVGRIVSLKVSPRRTIQAIVRWTRDNSAGLEFLQPIDLAEAEWLDGGEG